MKLILFPLLITITSCSFFSPNPKDKTYSYLTGVGLENPSSQEIKSALIRNSSMSGGNYQFNAFPYTYTLVEAMVREAAAQRDLSAEQQLILKKSLEEKYLENKTCFNFEFEVVRFKQSSRLQDWNLSIVDKTEQEFPAKWNKDDLKKRSILSKKVVAGDKLNKWLSEGVACTMASPKLASGFGIKVTPKFVQFPFDKSTKLYWEFPEIKIIDGKAQEVEGKKKSFRSYRGW